MSAVVAACQCVAFSDSTGVRFCATHHRYYRGPKELYSVSSVLKACWPVKKNFEAADPATLDNARQRGIAVDSLFSAYVAGKLSCIPAGTRTDAVDLFRQLKDWYDGLGVSCGASQVIMADDAIAGTCDLIVDGFIWDLKTVYAIDPSYEVQLGGYAELYRHQYGDVPRGIGIVHVTKRFAKPQVFELNLKTCASDWNAVRDVYLMAQRRTKK